MTDDFRFCSSGERRDRSELLHDLLMSAKDGMKITQLCRAVNYSWNPLMNMLEFAERKGLVEKVEITEKPELRGRRGSTKGWKTTPKGLKYARGVRENYQLLIQEVTV